MSPSLKKRDYTLDGVRIPLLKAWLEERGYTAVDFVELYNDRHARRNDRLNPSTFCRNYNGTNEPNWRRLERMAAIIGCSVNELRREFMTAKKERDEENYRSKAACRTREADAELVDEDGDRDYPAGDDGSGG